MNLLIILTVVFIPSLVVAFPRKYGKRDGERRRIIVHKHGAKRDHKQEAKHGSAKSKEIKHKDSHKVYKKFGMFAAPSFALEDSPGLQTQGIPGFQQVLVPVSSASLTQTTSTSPQMISAYTGAPATPSQRATLGTEVIGDQTSAQPVTTQAIQPQTVQYERAPMGTNEDNSVVKTSTQGSTLQEAGATPNEMVVSPANLMDQGSESIQSFTQQDSGKGTDEMKDLQIYNGPLPDSGQGKPQIEGVSPQEEIKVVNLGDDEKAANLQQDQTCGGCPSGAKCVSGQCQIREVDAQAQGLTGKGTANNPGSISDIHSLETQELASLLKDASKADTPPGAVPESPTSSSMTTEYTSQGQEQQQDQMQSIQPAKQQQKIQTVHQTAQFSKAAPVQQPATLTQQPATIVQPHFTSDQLKELRDFARMYKMYQFIRKMEERLNDPDCAPVCRKLCKDFCPAKCCHAPKVNTSVVSHMMQTAGKMQASGNIRQPKIGVSGMEDDSENGETEEQEEKNMDKNTAGKKHILIRILKHDESDKPRSDVRETV